MSKLEIKNWEGASTADLESFIKRKSHVSLVNGRIQGGNFIAECKPHEVGVVVKLDGIRFAGKSLKIRSLEASGQTSELMVLLQQFLQSRYDPANKLLNLASVQSEPVFIQRGMFETPSSTKKLYQALLKVADTMDVRSVSLANNNLSDIGPVEELSRTFPKLQNLSLESNFFGSAVALNGWKQRFQKLKELVLVGNPISDNAAEMKRLIDFFPVLERLNGVVVRTPEQLPKLPVPIQQNFFENETIQQLVQNFLATFFKFWDSDRAQLLPLYDNISEFSYTFDGFCPHLRHTGHSNGSQRWIGQSRNLTRASGANRAKFLNDKIAVGQQAIGEAFKRMPRTTHRLDHADKFSTEAWQLQNIRQTPDTGIVVAVHGECTETGPRGQRLGFDRFLILLPAGDSMLVASDMLTVRWPGNTEIFKSNGDPAAAAASPGPAQVPPPQGSVQGPAQGPVAGLLGGLPAGQAEIVQQLMQATGLNAEYAAQCAQQANFNLGMAQQLFEQHKGELPQAAFI